MPAITALRSLCISAISSSLSSCILLRSCSRAHRDPHSFPTRRSSDLAVAQFSGRDIMLKLPRRQFLHLAGSAAAPRSEEHTSELQSRVDLVCRLLLEKKNKHS